RVRLRYEALTRLWPRYAVWLQKRSLFRDAALFWEKHGRDPGALFTGSLLEEAGIYRDLNKREEEFVEAWRGEARRRGARAGRERLVGRATAAVIGVLLLGVVILLFAVRAAWRKENDTQEIKNEALEARTLAESSSTLALALLLEQEEEDAAHVARKILLA